ncbi:CHAP domain-containing protein [Micromonospora sp. NBC_01699]|uniref:CHAP domain-containing protein n=1 Tax=Micromonospora sp. NBC_01699 TaxID=2975984 RepID=UPI002E2CB8C4|nr:CHAP domain-containing protein [Micromonospora sp. NBC_01699]
MNSAWKTKFAPLMVAFVAVAALLVGGAVAAYAAPKPTADQKAKACQNDDSLSRRAMVVCIAKSQVGVKERGVKTRKADNCQKYFRDFKSNLNCDDDVNGQWCAAFTRWVWAKSGVPNTPKSFAVSSWANALTRITTPKAGDVAVATSGQHIEIVVKVSGTTIHTIDGNGGKNSVDTGSHRKGAMRYYRMPS